MSQGTDDHMAAERRARDRSHGIPLRRHRGQFVHTRQERRRDTPAGLNVAAALELHLDRFPTSAAMLVLLRSWLYEAERGGLCEQREAYCDALERALDALRTLSDPVAAIAVLQRA